MFRCANSESCRASAFQPNTKDNTKTMWKNVFTADCERGARLLLNFKSIAADELQNTKLDVSARSRLVPRIAALIPTQWEDFESDDKEEEYSAPAKRLRTVSLSFDEPPMSPLPVSPTPSDGSEATSFTSPGNLASEPLVMAVTPDTRKTIITLPDNLKEAEILINRPSSSSKLVGTEVKGPVKAVLQRKFSWKNYPALEAYLVNNREEYLQYSSELNYTAEQKRYNNTLTQGLLDVAKEEGYLFEDFTFAAIRDRIRCYYKSYVQATKKKKKRKRGSS